MGVFDSVGKFVSNNAGALVAGTAATAAAAGAYIYSDEIASGARRLGNWAGLTESEEDRTKRKAKKAAKKAKTKKDEKKAAKKAKAKKEEKKAKKTAKEFAEALAKGANKELKKLEKNMTPTVASKMAADIIAKAKLEADAIKEEAAQAQQKAMEIIDQAEAKKAEIAGLEAARGARDANRVRVVGRPSVAAVPKNKKKRVHVAHAATGT